MTEKRQVSVNLDVELIDKAQELASSQARSVSSLLAQAIYEFFNWKPQNRKKK